MDAPDRFGATRKTIRWSRAIRGVQYNRRNVRGGKDSPRLRLPRLVYRPLAVAFSSFANQEIDSALPHSNQMEGNDRECYRLCVAQRGIGQEYARRTPCCLCASRVETMSLGRCGSARVTEPVAATARKWRTGDQDR